MLKKSWIFLGALILIIVAVGLFYFNGYTSQTEGQVIRIDEITIEPIPESETEPPVTETPEPIQEIKEFTITAKRFGFTPETITVNQGDQVRLIVTSIDVTHGFSISEYGINEKLEPGKTITVEFIADKKGEFSMVCNIVCGSGHSGMRGKLIVN